MRRLVLLLPALLVLAVPPVADAGPQVPEVSQAALPIAGTCAPLPQANATLVTIGEVDWYRIDTDPRDVRGEQLKAVLMQRGHQAGRTGTRHDVWIVVDRNRPWGQVVQVLSLCQQTPLFRVGLQVQAESGEGILGFPLFLPPPGTKAGTSGVTARELKVRLEKPAPNPWPDAPKPESSHPDNLYLAAKNVVDRFGPVVAEASIRRGVSVQQAVRVIDLLYRAGCAAVKFPYLMMRRQKTEPVVQIWVKYGEQDRLLEQASPGARIPPIRAQKSPWSDDGAAQRGAWSFAIEPIPTGGRAPTRRRVVPLDNYAATGREVPAAALRASGEVVGDWAKRLGTAFRAVMRPDRPQFPAPLLVQSRRQSMGVDEFFSSARKTFKQHDDVRVSTVRAQAYLFKENAIVGRVDLTLALNGPSMGVVFARWVPGPYPAERVRLPPLLVDPYAAGVPGHLRVWIEGVLAAGRARGPAAVPLATERQVLSELPAVAHAGIRKALNLRLSDVNNLIGWLKATPYDRLFVETAEGSAAVHRAGRVEGILRFGLKPEEGELALTTLVAKAAPR